MNLFRIFMAALVLQSSLAANVANAQQVVASAPTSDIPFGALAQHSLNPVSIYRGAEAPPPSFTNSTRLNSLIRDGKLYLSLRNAIDLALENNLDIVIARYNLPIAQMDVLRTKAGGSVRGVNTGIVQGTPGGGAGGFGSSGSGTGAGAGGTSSGAGGAGAGASGIVSSTLGTGTTVSSYDPQISAQVYLDHTKEQLVNSTLYGVSVYDQNLWQFSSSYAQSFPTGSSIEVDWDSSRTTTNSANNSYNPQLYSYERVLVQQQLLAGFGLGPNLRYLHIARTNQKISDIAFRAQIISTVTQICDMYWDLVSAYQDEQVKERSVEFAQKSLDTGREQLKVEAIPQMDVLKSEGDLAKREQELTIARTSLELQELLMKNAITRRLEDSTFEEMPIIPTDHIADSSGDGIESAQDLIATALKNRTELLESALDLENRELSRKSARNAMLPTLTAYGFYAGLGYGGAQTLSEGSASATPTTGYGTALQNSFNNSSPEYQVGLQLSIPLRNRVARADQYRTELEYRQSQVYAEELRKRIRIEVRNARYALEQGVSRVASAQKARDLARKTLDIMQQEQKLGAGSNQQTLSAEHDLALASSELVAAETNYEKARIEVRRASGTVLDSYGISIDEAKSGVVEDAHP